MKYLINLPYPRIYANCSAALINYKRENKNYLSTRQKKKILFISGFEFNLRSSLKCAQHMENTLTLSRLERNWNREVCPHF